MDNRDAGPQLAQDLGVRARELARELATALASNVSSTQLAERLEQVLRATAQDERARCVAIATTRAEMWEASLARGGAAWPREGQVEARARLTEALALADRLLGPDEHSSTRLRLEAV